MTLCGVAFQFFSSTWHSLFGTIRLLRHNATINPREQTQNRFPFLSGRFTLPENNEEKKDLSAGDGPARIADDARPIKPRRTCHPQIKLRPRRHISVPNIHMHCTIVGIYRRQLIPIDSRISPRQSGFRHYTRVSSLCRRKLRCFFPSHSQPKSPIHFFPFLSIPGPFHSTLVQHYDYSTLHHYIFCSFILMHYCTILRTSTCFKSNLYFL